MPKTWKIHVPDPAQVEKLSKDAGVSKLLAWLLINRDICAADEAQKFLSPQIDNLLSAFDLEVFVRAGKMIAQAITDGSKIGVHGDYDVDGITSTALLYDFFRALKVPCEYYLPHRTEDGYGLSANGVAQLAQAGVKLLIAVDCGITDLDAVKKAKDLGMQVLVLDHHRPPETLPPADIIIDAHLDAGMAYFQDLCSAGLVFFLLLQLRKLLREGDYFKKAPEPNLRRSLDLVALGTIADVAPVKGINRILLSYGIKEISQTGRFGLRLLKKRAGVRDDDLGYGQVAFNLAPRLNAAGRIDEADPGFELLTSQDPKRANELADELERRNRLRQSIEEKIIKEAVEQFESQPDWEKKKSIVVAGPDWHPGVVGIVAQRLREKYCRPALALSLSEGIGRGSGRSVGGLDLYQALERCSGHLLEFGGHRMACGLSLSSEKLEPFRAAFESAVVELAEPDAFEEVLLCDAEVPLFTINGQMIDEIEKLKPFGPGNSEPLLVARSVLVLDCQVKSEKHLWFLLRERDASFPAMFFRANIDPLKAGSLVDIAYTINRSIWRDKPQLKLVIKDLKRLT